MKLIFLFPLVILSGCVYQTVDQFDLYRATKLCGSVENIVEISAHAAGSEFVFCKNGTRYGLDSANSSQ